MSEMRQNTEFDPSRGFSTPEEWEQACQLLAYKQAYRQLQTGNAPAQIVVQFLKSGSREQELRLAQMQAETTLAEAKVENMQAAKVNDAKYNQLIEALTRYQGRDYNPGDPFGV